MLYCIIIINIYTNIWLYVIIYKKIYTYGYNTYIIAIYDWSHG